MNITRIRFFSDDQKEEAWINEMSAKGWHLKKFFTIFFTFEKGEQGKYVYRNEYIEGQPADYIEFLKESNIECACKTFGWAYFRKEATEDQFELYTDTASKLRYLTKLFNLYLMLFVPNFICLFLNIYLGFVSEKTKYLSFGAASLSLIASLLMLVAMYKVQKRRKITKNNLGLFEG